MAINVIINLVIVICVIIVILGICVANTTTSLLSCSSSSFYPHHYCFICYLWEARGKGRSHEFVHESLLNYKTQTFISQSFSVKGKHNTISSQERWKDGHFSDSFESHNFATRLDRKTDTSVSSDGCNSARVGSERQVALTPLQSQFQRKDIHLKLQQFLWRLTPETHVKSHSTASHKCLEVQP